MDLESNPFLKGLDIESPIYTLACPVSNFLKSKQNDMLSKTMTHALASEPFPYRMPTISFAIYSN